MGQVQSNKVDEIVVPDDVAFFEKYTGEINHAHLEQWHGHKRAGVMNAREIKLVLVGCSGTGKSTMALRLSGKRKEEVSTVDAKGVRTFLSSFPTIGASFYSVFGRLCGGEEDIFLQASIWDTAGQKRYFSLLPMYTRGASLLLMFYDVSDRMSFEQIKTKFWPQVRGHTITPRCCLLGIIFPFDMRIHRGKGHAMNISDSLKRLCAHRIVQYELSLDSLPSELRAYVPTAGGREVLPKEAREFATSHGMEYFECEVLDVSNDEIRALLAKLAAVACI